MVKPSDLTKIKIPLNVYDPEDQMPIDIRWIELAGTQLGDIIDTAILLVNAHREGDANTVDEMASSLEEALTSYSVIPD